MGIMSDEPPGMYIPARMSVKVDPDSICHPPHYTFSEFEPIKVIRAWDLSFALGNVVKYVVRAGRKDPAKIVEDLKKASVYLNDEIAFWEGQQPSGPGLVSQEQAVAAAAAFTAEREAWQQGPTVVSDGRLVIY